MAQCRDNLRNNEANSEICVDATTGHLMVDGRIIETANPRDLFERIRRTGYVPTA